MKTQTNTPNPDQDSGALAGFDTIDAIAAFVFHKEGEAGLRQVFEMANVTAPDPENASSHGNREMLEDAAYELQRRGLDQVAAVLLDIAPHCPSGIDNVPTWCVNYYVVEERPEWIASWRSKWLQDREMHLDRRFPELRRKLTQKARQPQTTEQKPAPHKD